MGARILIVDDDRDFALILAKHLRSRGGETVCAHDANDGLAAVKSEKPDIVLLDVKLPDSSGVELAKEISSLDPDIPIIMVSGSGQVDLVVAAMQAGASDYVTKPVDNDELWKKMTSLLEIRRARAVKEEVSIGSNVICESEKGRQLVREIGRVAGSDAPVLLYGESGTGKSLVAQVIHEHSPRREKPFVTIACPAIPENLLESELFGHERGAFTGAVKEKMGMFEAANNGTIFLDEIGDLSMSLQVKLLRVLQNHEFERVGSVKTVKVDVRVIAATNRNLEQAMKEKHFREDLFYRLNVLPIYVPPLRDRKEDIRPLTEHFMKYYGKKSGKRFSPLSETVMNHLVGYDWPGNIRELQNVIERAVVLGKEPRLAVSDLAFGVREREVPEEKGAFRSLKDLEFRSLTEALEKTTGNISKAAKILGVGRDTLYRRMKKYNIGLKK